MGGTAVILCGIPAEAHRETVARLNAKFPVGYVFRGTASKLSPHRRARYTESEVAKAIAAAADAIFGTTKRSFSFCRNPQRACAEQQGLKGKTCGLQAEQACALQAPSRLIVLFQEGDEENRLLSRFYYSALSAKIPYKLYNNKSSTASLCVDYVEKLMIKARSIESVIRNRNNPLLLPPKNFGQKAAVSKLLSEINDCAEVKRRCEEFRRNYYLRDARKFEGSRGLGFKPAQRTEQHGRAGDVASAVLAIPKVFRLGCTYDNSQHWDVEPLDEKGLQKRYSFTCRQFGAQRPSKNYANIWPDDWLGEL